MIWKSLGITQLVMEYHKEGDVSTLSKNWRAHGFSICWVLKNDRVGIIYGYIE